MALSAEEQEALKKKTEEEEALKAKLEEAKKKLEEEAEVDPTVKSIMEGGSDAIAELLEKKRKANAEAKELRLEKEKRDKEDEEKEKKRLEEQGKFKELAEKEKESKEKIEKKLKEQIIIAALERESTKARINDLILVDLIPRKEVKIDEDFEVTGAKEAVETFKKDKPDFFSEEEEEENLPPGERRPGLTLRKKLSPEDRSKVHRRDRLTQSYEKTEKRGKKK